MAITKIDDVFLYTGVTAGSAESWRIKDFLVTNNIKYTLMFYGDDSSHNNIFEALNSWWPGANLTDFPILVYTEIHDDLSPSQYPRKFFKSLAEIEASDFLSTYKSTNSNPV